MKGDDNMHIEKYKNCSVRAILGHLKREHDHYSNENVDLEKSKNNHYFINRDLEYYNNRLEKDLYVYGGWNDKYKAKYNTLCNIVVHCPKSYADKDKFFDMMNHILCCKYGKENVICSVVHKDEAEGHEHLHFSFIPCIFNSKKKKYQLSYEKCMAHSFDSFHDDIEQLLEFEFGIKINLHSEDKENDKFYFDNIEDYKKLKLELEQKQNELNSKNEELENIQNKLNSKNAEFKDLEDKYNDLYVRFQKNIKVIDEQENYIYDLKTKLFKCIDLLNEAERKDIKLLGFSPLSNELDSLYKKVDEIERG